VGVVEGVVSGLLHSKGEGREPRTPSFQTRLTPLCTGATGAVYGTVAHGFPGRHFDGRSVQPWEFFLISLLTDYARQETSNGNIALVSNISFPYVVRNSRLYAQ
jgi:hypothetical protein